MRGDAATRQNLISSIFLEPEELEQHNLKLDRKFKEITRNEVRYEEYRADDAELLVVAYGVVSRIVYSTIDQAREEGLKVGLLRPITLWPFPSAAIRAHRDRVKHMLAIELSTGQMVEDVRLAVEGHCPVHFYGRCGGMVPGGNEILEQYRTILAGGAH
ncbi:MAG: hypothetical protein R3D98_08245 [Candidatus Krumholzibacteriia bacterium]